MRIPCAEGCKQAAAAATDLKPQKHPCCWGTHPKPQIPVLGPGCKPGRNTGVKWRQHGCQMAPTRVSNGANTGVNGANTGMGVRGSPLAPTSYTMIFFP